MSSYDLESGRMIANGVLKTMGEHTARERAGGRQAISELRPGRPIQLRSW